MLRKLTPPQERKEKRIQKRKTGPTQQQPYLILVEESFELVHQIGVQQLQHQAICMHANQRRDRLAMLQKAYHRRRRTVALVGVRGEDRRQRTHRVKHAAVVVGGMVGAVPQVGAAGLGDHQQLQLVDVHEELLHEATHQAALLDQTAAFGIVLQGQRRGVQGLVEVSDEHIADAAIRGVLRPW